MQDLARTCLGPCKQRMFSAYTTCCMWFVGAIVLEWLMRSCKCHASSIDAIAAIVRCVIVRQRTGFAYTRIVAAWSSQVWGLPRVAPFEPRRVLERKFKPDYGEQGAISICLTSIIAKQAGRYNQDKPFRASTQFCRGLMNMDVRLFMVHVWSKNSLSSFPPIVRSAQTVRDQLAVLCLSEIGRQCLPSHTFPIPVLSDIRCPDKFRTAGALVAVSNVLHTHISVDCFHH